MPGPPAPSRLRLHGGLAAAILLAGSLYVATRPEGGEEGQGLDPAVQQVLARHPDLAGNRVLLVGFDGCDPTHVRERVEAGDLPNFARLIREGAFGPLRSQHPMLSPLLWTTVATGKWPTEHGVFDFMVKDEESPGGRTTMGSRNRQVEAMWDIAGRYGRKVGLVGWLASHPAEQVNGFAVSERMEPLAYLYKEAVPESDEGKTWPRDLVDHLRTFRRAPSSVTHAEIRPFLDVTEEEYRAACTGEDFTQENRVNNLRLIYAGAENFLAYATRLWEERRPDLLCVYFEELDSVGHNFMGYREPVNWKPLSADEILDLLPRGVEVDAGKVRALVARIQSADRSAPPVELDEVRDRALIRSGLLPQIASLAQGPKPEHVRKWGGAVDAAYRHADRILGRFLDLADARTTVILLSDHGFAHGEDKPPFDSTFNDRRGGAQYHTLHGVFGAWGHGVRPGATLPLAFQGDEGARLLDICPTVLALLGFPKGEDMPGRVLTEVFDLDLPAATVPTYETDRSARLAREEIARASRLRRDTDEASDDAVDAEMRRLAERDAAALGYVGGAGESQGRKWMHLGRSYMEQERYAEAEEAFLQALPSVQGPQRATVLHLLGILRLRDGDLEGAEARFREILAQDPEHPPAIWGMIRVLEKRGDRPAVRKGWERIVELHPDVPLFRIRLADAIREAPEGPDDLARAVELIRQALPRGEDGEEDLDQVGPAVHNIRGKVLLDTGKFEEAEEAFRRAADADPKYVTPRNNMAVLHLRLAGIAQLQALASPGEAAARHEEGVALHRAEALEWIEEVLAIDPDNAKARFNRAEIFTRLAPQDLPAAEKELLLALEADPDYRKAASMLEAVRRAMAAPERE